MSGTGKQIPASEAFLVAVLERYRRRWFRFVLRVLGNYEDAEDALQEGVRRVLGCNRDFKAEEDLRMYLARAISNTAFEIYKLRKRQRVSHVPVPEHFPFAPRPDPPTILEEREREERKERMLSMLDDALAGLPVREYEALCLTVLESDGSSIRDAGVEHGIPYSTLRHRRKEGLRRLRKYLIRNLRRSNLSSLLA